MACDPLVPHTVPFVETVEPGRYTLRAWVAVLHKDGAEWQRQITALQLVIVDEPAVSWTMALIPGQDLAALDEDGYFGYGVDAGTGTLADRVATRRSASGATTGSTKRSSQPRSPLDPINAVRVAIAGEPTGANVYVAGLGWGDGCYATYVSWTADGRISSWVTDFRVLPTD